MPTNPASTVPAMDVFRRNVMKHVGHGATITGIAKSLGKSHATISAILHGRGGNCTIKTAAAIADAIGVPLHELFDPRYEL